jgi:hypothetical protein
MALFGRTPIADPELRQLLGRRRVLATARSPQGEVLGLADALIFPEGAHWRQVPWHEIENGGWDHPSRTLRWTTVDGTANSLRLDDIGMLPDLFNERVTASIACVRTVDLADQGTAVITARRNLARNDAELIWRVTPGKGVLASAVEADPVVALELERLRAEYDLG